MEDDRKFARIGYEAYARFTGGKTFDGREMPTWDALTERIKDAWQEASASILQQGLADNLRYLANELEKDEATRRRIS